MRGFVRSVRTRVALTSIAMATTLSTIGLPVFAETSVSPIPNYVVAAKQVAVGQTKQFLGQQLVKQLNTMPDLSRLMQSDQAQISHTRASLNRAMATLRSKAKKLPRSSQNAALAALNNFDQNTNIALNSASTFLQDVHKQSGKLAKLIVIGWKYDKYHFVEGGTTAILNDFGLPSYGSDPIGNARAENAYYAGKVIGDMLASIGGLALTVEGLTGMTVGTIGGLATSETIVGALVGVGVDVISIGEVAAGSTVMAASVKNFRSDDENLNSEQGVYSKEQVDEGTANPISVEVLNSKPLYRVMSAKELQAVKDTGILRGGRAGTTFFTDSSFSSAAKAQSRLALGDTPEYIVEFKITNNPAINGGTKVTPLNDQLGGGREYWTNDPIQIQIINYQKLG